MLNSAFGARGKGRSVGYLIAGGSAVRADFTESSGLLAVQDALPRHAEYLAMPGVGEGDLLEVGGE